MEKGIEAYCARRLRVEPRDCPSGHRRRPLVLSGLTSRGLPLQEKATHSPRELALEEPSQTRGVWFAGGLWNFLVIDSHRLTWEAQIR